MKGSAFPLTRLSLLVLLSLLIIGAGVYFGVQRLEGDGPTLTLTKAPAFLGNESEIAGLAADEKNGLRSLRVSLMDNAGKERILLDEEFPNSGFLSRSDVKRKSFSIRLSARDLKLPEGKALLRLHATDYSLRDWGKGNTSYLEIPVQVDTRPPVVSVLSRAHNVNQGGAGLVIYRVSEPPARSGVRVGDHFYPGHPGPFSDTGVFVAFIAVGYDQGPDTKMMVEAEDEAGNKGLSSFYQHIRAKRFRADSVNLSEGFLSLILPRFEPIDVDGGEATPIEKFLVVNREIRESNEEVLKGLCKKSEPGMKWEGAFARMENSAPMARFADHRSYRYQGEVRDEQTHKGYDLASLANAPVPAANSGTVIFAEPLGIYGLTVALDHGYGIISHYSHLSRIDVSEGQEVKKGDAVGLSGSTGLAGGDHLHYGVLVEDTFVNPIEWWDAHWIKDNITDKLKSVGQSLSAAAPQQ